MDKENVPANLEENSKTEEIQETEINDAELDEVRGGTAMDEMRKLQQMMKMIADAQENLHKTMNATNNTH